MSSSCSNERLGIMFLVSVNFMVFRVPKNLGCPWSLNGFMRLLHCIEGIYITVDVAFYSPMIF